MELDLLTIMRAIPANVFFKDTQARYRLVTQLCGMLNGESDGRTIIGKTDLEIQPDARLGEKFYQEDLELIRDGGRKSYLQKMNFGGIDYYYRISKQAVTDSTGSCIGLIGMVEDMTESVLAQKKLEGYGFRDEMTGVYNRSYYEKHQDKLSDGKYPTAVIMADCNGLKFVNDTYGHEQGDYLIISTVNNIRRCVKDGDKIIRMGGDEFLILCPGCDSKTCEKLIGRIKDAEKEISINGICLSTSYGYAILENQEECLEDIVKEADEKMYQEKKHSKIRDEETGQRELYNIKEKNRIAQYAAQLLQPGDVVFLDAGTTTGKVINYLETPNVTFVTNSPSHARKLVRLGYTTHVLGGELKAVTEATVGPAVLESLKNYHFTKGFFGCNGVDNYGSFLTPDVQEADVKREALQQCEKKYILCDSSKFSQISSEKFADISEVTVITNRGEDDGEIRIAEWSKSLPFMKICKEDF